MGMNGFGLIEECHYFVHSADSFRVYRCIWSDVASKSDSGPDHSTSSYNIWRF